MGDSPEARRPLAACLRRLGREDGQSLIIIIFAIGLLFGIGGLALATSSYWVAQHRAQNAADAAALSAAQDLTTAEISTTQDASAEQDGTTMALADDPGSTIQTTVPAGGDATEARVVVTKQVSLPFGFAATVSGAATAKNSVVANGSFTSTFTTSWIEYCAANGVVTEGQWANSWQSCDPASPDMGSWTVYSGGVDLNHYTYVAAPSSDPQAQSVDMEGTCSYSESASPEMCTNQVNGIIDEPLTTIQGDTYTLSFLLSVNYNGPPQYKPMSTYISSDDDPATTTGPEQDSYDLSSSDATLLGTLDPSYSTEGVSPGWTEETYTFTAPASTTYLWFVSQVGCVPSNESAPDQYTAVAPNCNNGAAITDIVVTGPVSDNLTQ